MRECFESVARSNTRPLVHPVSISFCISVARRWIVFAWTSTRLQNRRHSWTKPIKTHISGSHNGPLTVFCWIFRCNSFTVYAHWNQNHGSKRKLCDSTFRKPCRSTCSFLPCNICDLQQLRRSDMTGMFLSDLLQLHMSAWGNLNSTGNFFSYVLGPIRLLLGRLFETVKILFQSTSEVVLKEKKCISENI